MLTENEARLSRGPHLLANDVHPYGKLKSFASTLKAMVCPGMTWHAYVTAEQIRQHMCSSGAQLRGRYAHTCIGMLAACAQLM